MSDDKKKSTIDHIIMGAIIGTAIGSALGVSVAPKKGTETRSIAKETATGIFKFGKAVMGRLLKKAKKNLHTENAKNMKKIPNEMEIIPPKSVDHD